MLIYLQRQIEVKEGDVVRFGRIPFKIAKLVLDPSKQVDVSIDDRNKSVSEDISVDISARPTMFRSAQTSIANNTTFAEDAHLADDPQPINLKNPIVQSSAMAGGLGAALNDEEAIKS